MSSKLIVWQGMQHACLANRQIPTLTLWLDWVTKHGLAKPRLTQHTLSYHGVAKPGLHADCVATVAKHELANHGPNIDCVTGRLYSALAWRTYRQCAESAVGLGHPVRAQ